MKPILLDSPLRQADHNSHYSLALRRGSYLES